MAFSNGQNVQAADLNNFSVTTVTTTGDITVGDDLAVAGDLAVTGTITMGGVGLTPITRQICSGRLTLTTAVPVTTADVTAATTLYFALYGGNQIALYDGASTWSIVTFSELSIAVPGTTNQMYDVFVYNNAGVATLELTAWTNDTTRATALTLQDGVLVKTGVTSRRYVGSFRTTGVSGQTEDSYAKRFVWNYYNRVRRSMRVLEATNTWTYTLATFRQANGAAANQLAFVVGVAEVELEASVRAIASTTETALLVAVGIGIDSTTVAAAGGIFGQQITNVNNEGIDAHLLTYPAVGYHVAVWLEYSTATGTTTWLGDNGTATLYQAGISGSLMG